MEARRSSSCVRRCPRKTSRFFDYNGREERADFVSSGVHKQLCHLTVSKIIDIDLVLVLDIVELWSWSMVNLSEISGISLKN